MPIIIVEGRQIISLVQIDLFTVLIECSVDHVPTKKQKFRMLEPKLNLFSGLYKYWYSLPTKGEKGI